MSTSWIRDKVIAVAEAEAEITGKDADDIIWQLSKELGKMVQISGETIVGRLDMDKPLPEGVTGLPFVPTFKTGDEPEFQERKARHYDAVSKPSHYSEGRTHMPKDVIRDWGLNFNLGSAVKYLSRAGRKGDAIEDLKKAITCVQFEIEALTEESDRGTSH